MASATGRGRCYDQRPSILDVFGGGLGWRGGKQFLETIQAGLVVVDDFAPGESLGDFG